MKYYTITVNGNTYNVTVEEGISAAPAKVSTAPVAAAQAAPVAPASAPAAAPTTSAAPAAPAASGSVGSVKVSAPMPGKIISTKTSVGQSIKKGEVILILEAMKMENEIVAPSDGTIASIDVSAGQTVEAGTLLATLN